MKFMQYINVCIRRFLALKDTPSTYTGQSGKYVAVNVGENALEFVDVPAGGTGASPPTTVTSTTTNTDSGTDHTHELDELHTDAKSATFSSVTIDKKGRVTALTSGTLSAGAFQSLSNNVTSGTSSITVDTRTTIYKFSGGTVAWALVDAAGSVIERGSFMFFLQYDGSSLNTYIDEIASTGGTYLTAIGGELSGTTMRVKYTFGTLTDGWKFNQIFGYS